MPDTGRKTAVLGGGITGLTAAYRLQQAGQQVHLFEASDRLGGKVSTCRQNELVIEEGPDSFITQKPYALDLCREIGLQDELIPCNIAMQKAFLAYRGQLHKLPTGFRLAAPSQWGPLLTTPLLSPQGKVRAAMEYLLPGRKNVSDESVDAFLRRRMGREVAERIAGPLMAGIYVADYERLSMQSTFPMFTQLEHTYGSLIRGLRAVKKKRAGKPAPPMFMSMRKGMQQLTDALQEHITGQLFTGRKGTRLTYQNQQWTLHTANGNAATYDHIILALPSHHAADLLQDVRPDIATDLRTIRQVSTAVLSMTFNRADFQAEVQPEGFGFVVPKSEPQRMLACTWSSTKFAGRAPDHTILMRTFFGGACDEAAADLPQDELEAIALADLQTLIKLKSAPVDSYLQRWPKANPQYDVGHAAHVADIEAKLTDSPGLHLAGSSYHGIGLPDCIHSASRAAAQIAKH